MYSETNKLIAEFMGWKFIKGSKVGIDGYPFGGHDGFELSDVWVLNPTEKYLNNPCHYHYEYMDGKYNDDIEQSDLFEDYTYENGLEYHSSWDWLMPVVEKIENLNLKEFFLNGMKKKKLDIILCQFALILVIIIVIFMLN